MRERLGVSERRACRVLGQARATQRRKLRARDDEEALVGEVIDLASRFGRYGYRTVTGLLRLSGWCVNKKRVVADQALDNAILREAASGNF